MYQTNRMNILKNGAIFLILKIKLKNNWRIIK